MPYGSAAPIRSATNSASATAATPIIATHAARTTRICPHIGYEIAKTIAATATAISPPRVAFPHRPAQNLRSPKDARKIVEEQGHPAADGERVRVAQQRQQSGVGGDFATYR